MSVSETAESRPATSTSSSRAVSLADVRDDPRRFSLSFSSRFRFAQLPHRSDRLGQLYLQVLPIAGPDGLKPYKLATDQVQYIGENDKSRENTDALSYLFRPPKGMPFPKAKNGQISETGWEIEHLGRGRYT
ncbi:hypothetical protein NP493_800g00004 [Ridgeia piscesae]|uniref:Uncharacterized protein n=1 Tax=Ridgeia piscesae TaxID=27915 RepID=A0AAD9NN27_RIDPI|nr:hypothetical protein NP493_800g00004 [Ridgeia piscesae]